jgi:leader peptidase (prepilin peptidase)/N-methyltransferase
LTITTLPSWVLWTWWFALGSCIGSFLNVCIYRMPREQSIVKPRSRCPQCERPIAGYDNIPLLSFLLLRARCRHCRAAISWRYPLVEAFTGLTAVIMFQHFGLGLVGLIYFAFVCALITASVIDLDFQIIPDEISLGGLVLGLILSVLVPQLHGTASTWIALQRSVIGLLAGGGVLYATGLLGDFVFRKESMGGGDIKLLAMAGTLLGWKLVLLTFFVSPVLALIPGLLVLCFKKSHVIPYGPFLSLGLVISMFYGQQLLIASGVEESLRLLWEYHPWHP